MRRGSTCASATMARASRRRSASASSSRSRGWQRRPQTKGTGLGLYITRGIVAAHSGELGVVNRVEDERAHGAVFTIALPLQAGV